MLQGCTSSSCPSATRAGTCTRAGVDAGSPDQHPPCRSRSFGQSGRLLRYSGAGAAPIPTLPLGTVAYSCSAPAAEARLGCGGGRDLGLASSGGPVGVRLGNDASPEPER